MGGICPPFEKTCADLRLILALKLQFFELAALALQFRLVLVDLLVLLSRLIIPSL